MTEELKANPFPKFLEKVNSNNLDMSITEIRELIAAVENKLKEYPQTEVPLQHYFSKAVYGREIAFNKDTIIVGKIHKYQSLNIISKGEVSVLSIDGLIRVKAPYTFVSSPGAKRLIYAHEDTVWTTIHGTEETDIDKIEEEFIAKDYSDLIEAKDVKVIEARSEVCHG